MNNKSKEYVVMWFDPNNSVARKGGVEYKGKKIFESYEEAREAMIADRNEEFSICPDSQMTYEIFDLNKN